MSKKHTRNNKEHYSIDEIEKKVIRVLGKQRDNITTITNANLFHDYVSSCIDTGIIAIDTETNNSLDPLTCKIMGLCLYSPGLKYAYIPINHRDHKTKVRLATQLTEADVKAELQRVIDSKIKIIMHNGKFDYEVLKCACDISVKPDWDTMIAAILLNENEKHGLKYQYISKIDKTQESYDIEGLFENTQYADVNPEIFALYSATDAYMTYKLYEYQLPMMESEKKIFKLFTEIEMPLVTIVAEMELCGALVDTEYCNRLTDKYETKLSAIDRLLEEEITKIQSIIDDWKTSPEGQEKEFIFATNDEMIGLPTEELEKKYPLFDPIKNLRYRYGKTYASQLKREIKLSSPKQLAILLYKVLNAPTVNKKKPMGIGKQEIEKIQSATMMLLSTLVGDAEDCGFDDIDITKMKSVISICELLLERRSVDKLITTYLKQIPTLAAHWSDGKIRFHLNQLGARTGRFTSGGDWRFYENETKITLKGMNQQNLPSENHEIRLIFKAEPGRTFVGGDISQQEPKITAHISQDPTMLEVYEDGKDIYASIAQSIYHNNYEDNLEFVDKEKTITNADGKRRRKTGKVIILATMYGMGASSVAEKINKEKKEGEELITTKEAKEMLDNFYAQFSGVKKAIDYSETFCKKHGYVEDIWGRKRRLPNIQKPLYETRFIGEPSRSDKSAEKLLKTLINERGTLSKEELKELRTQAAKNNIIIISNEEYIKKAKRQSFNARIQGSAATLTKMIMVMVDRDPLIKKLGGRIVFQIHDELILDCPTENAEALKKRLKAIMENSSTKVGIVLPMKCDMTTESRWGEDAMTTELKDCYKKLVEANTDNPITVLCEKFPNFPQDSIRSIIENNNETIKFK